jgi:hypothetical protein
MSEVFLEFVGDGFAAGAAIVGSPLREYARVQCRGESTGGKRGAVCETSGLQVCVGGDDSAALEQQIADARVFLRVEAAEIRRLRGLPGVAVARLRFGDEWPEGIVAHFPTLPSELLLACGELGLDIVLCQYLVEKWREHDTTTSEPTAAPNGGPTRPVGNSGVAEGPPSVS